MQRMNRRTAIITQLCVCGALWLGLAANLQAADSKVDGTWGWTMQARNGGEERKITLKLKTEGEKLTGKLSSPGREGAVNEVEITEGKIKGEEVSFTVVRKFNDREMKQKYTGKVAGDTIKGKISFDRQGEAMTRDWEAKRQAEKK